MTPDAKLRMEVYQEGQRAYLSGASCPYSDWRIGTWKKGREAAKTYYAGMACQPTPDPIEIPYFEVEKAPLPTALADLEAQLRQDLRDLPRSYQRRAEPIIKCLAHLESLKVVACMIMRPE